MRITTPARNFGSLRHLGTTVPILCTPLTSGTGFADTLDPSSIKAEDGYWYSYGTSDPLREDEKETLIIPMVLALQV